MTSKQEVAITFHDDNGFGDGYAAINIKCHNFPDLGDDLDDQDHQHVWDRTQEDWHEQAAGIAHTHGYSAFFTEGRSGGWLVPFRQIDATGQLQRYGAGFPQWSGCGGDKGQPVYPDVTEQRERDTFVAFRADIEELLELVPDMARQNAELYRQDRADRLAEVHAAEREAERRDTIVREADERFTDRRETAEALPPFTHSGANVERFDTLAKMVRAEVHTDDHAFEYDFDAAPWFEQATDEQIVALANCGWGGDYPADAVAHWMADHDDRLCLMFGYLETAANIKDIGFECHVDDGDAGRWLAKHRPQLLAALEGVAP